MVTDFKAKERALTPGQQSMKDRMCFKCKGFCHLQRECPNKLLVSYDDHQVLLASLEKDKERASLDNVASASF